VSNISVNKPTGEKPPPLFSLRNGRWIKDQVINDLMAAKAAEGNKRRNNYNDQGD
jgi:hypothetical protein